MEERNEKYKIQLTDEQYLKIIDSVEKDTNKKWETKVRELYEHYKDTGYYELESVLQELLQKGDK